MDLGAWTYAHNSLGERTSWTDAKSQLFTQTYDEISRPVQRTDPDMSTNWNWGSTGIATGRLSSIQSTTTGYTETYSYDSIGRTSAVAIAYGGTTYNYDYLYDNTGRLSRLTYPTSTASVRVAVMHTYQYGILKSVYDNTAGASTPVYWQATGQNARGQVTADQLGNGIVRSRAFDAVTGWQANVQAGVGGGAAVLNQSYGYDLVGNVTQRQDGNAGLTENFYYDNLYRLDYAQLNGVTNLDVAYNALGNITSRSDVGGGAAWSYHATKKHAVLTAGSNSYAYDANGNMTSRAGATITWTSFNYPSALPVPGGTATFTYGPGRQYIASTMPHPDGGLTETTTYLGGLLEKSVRGSATDWRHYVKVNGETVALISRKSSGVNTVSYVLSDHQGSPAVLSSSSGSTLLKESYAAFGGSRSGATWSGSMSSGDQITMANLSRQGYTGHTMAGFGGLIHMNGRVQDSVTGRFISPDPYVTEPGHTQGYNRYAYVRNNPATFIDPSGFAEDCIKHKLYLMSQSACQNDMPLEALLAAQRLQLPFLDMVTVTGTRGFHQQTVLDQQIQAIKDRSNPPHTAPPALQSGGKPSNQKPRDNSQTRAEVVEEPQEQKLPEKLPTSCPTGVVADIGRVLYRSGQLWRQAFTGVAAFGATVAAGGAVVTIANPAVGAPIFGGGVVVMGVGRTSALVGLGVETSGALLLVSEGAFEPVANSLSIAGTRALERRFDAPELPLGVAHPVESRIDGRAASGNCY